MDPRKTGPAWPPKSLSVTKDTDPTRRHALR